jgi:hypothetical protein
MDEQLVQLLKDRYEAIEMKPGSIKKEDFQYVRNGVVVFLCFLLRIWVGGMWMHVSVVQRLIGLIRLIIW